MSNLELVVILLALVASGFFSMMEIAFLSSNKLMIELDKKEGGLSAKIVHYFLRHSSLYLGTMLVGNNIALVIYGLYMGKVIIAVLFPELINSDTLTFYPLLIQTSISTLVILFTAEFLPKSIGRINPNKLLQLTWPFILFFGVVLYPITILSIGISEGLLKLFNITDEEESENALRFGKVDLDNYVKEISNRSHDEEGVGHEIQIFKDALDFSKVKSRDCMVPRTEILAIELSKLFLEVIISNGFDEEALKVLKKKKNLRLIDGTNYTFKEKSKFISSNEELLVQTEDLKKLNNKDFKIVSKRKPNSKQMKDLVFAFNICRFVKSNAIVLAVNETTTGIGSGQPSRLDSCQIAIEKMKIKEIIPV